MGIEYVPPEDSKAAWSVDLRAGGEWVVISADTTLIARVDDVEAVKVSPADPALSTVTIYVCDHAMILARWPERHEALAFAAEIGRCLYD